MGPYSAKCWPQTSQRQGISAQAQYHATRGSTTFGLELAHIHPTWGNVRLLLLNDYFSRRLLSRILVVSHLKTQLSDTQLSVIFPFIYHYFGDKHYAFIQKYNLFPFFTRKKNENVLLHNSDDWVYGIFCKEFLMVCLLLTNQKPPVNWKLFVYSSYSCKLPYNLTKHTHSCGIQDPLPASVYKWWQVEYLPLQPSK